ncbi:unnamed protein product [Ceutorhynchus assimilis]|uniref:Multidrug resistance-associated protein lethal(2)03659 n=1 Tax=Ceutorhynchus assimilis TaxID=467358 RepID=A0A9N9MR15_9CUCU|nr:unnamed protein product [Ceutorhynchus assimilis]
MSTENMDPLVCKRGAVKAKITNFEKFVLFLENKYPENVVTDRVNFLDLESRFETFSGLASEFEQVQDSIEAICPLTDLEKQYQERVTFDNNYHLVVARARIFLSDSSVDQDNVVNLLSNDVNRFDVAVIFAHHLWLGPLQTILCTYMMYLQVGISAVVGVILLIVFIPMLIYLGKRISILRLKTALRTDERVRLMNEIISGIQVIKMYAWEKPFAMLVDKVRRFEIKAIRNSSYMRGVQSSFIMFSTRLSIFGSILAYILLGNNVTAEKVFVLTSFYNILRIFIKNGTAKWTETSIDNTLTNINLTVTPGKLLTVIGPVGSGKSSLLHMILQELPLSGGSLEVNGEISYASQEPWLFAGSVRQNILFGLPMDRIRYNTVVRKCSLERDFQLLPYGDKTFVGDRGVSLSGGQRARINLARAVYKQADIYLLDDPLSAVDTHVGKALFEQCITGFLRDKTVVLITHQLQYLKEVEEQKGSGSVGAKIYAAYFKAGGNGCTIFMTFFLFVFAQFLGSIVDYFITFWVNIEQQDFLAAFEATNGNQTYNASNPIIESMNYTNTASWLTDDGFQPKTDGTEWDFWHFSRETCIYIYSALILALIVFTMIRAFDMGAIDELLTSSLIDVLQIGLSLLGIIVVVAIVSPWLLIPTVIVGIVFHYMRIFYLKTSRSVKRLEGITRSPVFSHLNATLQGLTTIRAFRAEEVLSKEFDSHQDLHSSAWFSFIATSRAFGYWLDMVCIVYITTVTFSFLLIGSEKFGGNVGLAITQAIGLTGMFQWGMRQSTELENQMTSVERVVEYDDIEHEGALESAPSKKPPKSWPSQGKIEFKHVYLRYFPNDPPVLRDLSFSIQSKEKIGIVGRTGAGKSSTINALFQLSDTTGSIIIDDINITEIGLHDLRTKISIIPQEPVLFSGTMRKNLDPFDEYSDSEIWKALEDVELKQAVDDLTAGLNSQMSEGGSNFSVGQRQLVCLARAILRNNKILVMDEATANVDPQTDALIQHTIRRKFADCTVLTIAHRLNTVMDSDKVLVMDAGTMKEFDHPYILLQEKTGVLYSMVQQTGKSMAENLYEVAKQNYETHHKSDNN